MLKPEDYSFHSWIPKRGVRLGAIAMMLGVMTLTGCNTGPDNEEIQEGQTNVTTEDVAEAEGVNTEDIATEDTQSLIGETVTIRGDLDQDLEETAFVLQSDEFLGGDSVLVLNPTGEPLVLPTEDTPVQVTGEVTEFVLTEVEDEYGLELEDELYADYENQPVIIAESIALAPTAEELSENPELFYDQVIAMEGNVRDIYSPSAFSLFDEGWVDDMGVLVVGAEQNLKAEDSALQEDETVVVTGTARPFDANALQEEYDLGLEPDVLSEFEERYNRPVIVAEEVYPSAIDE